LNLRSGLCNVVSALEDPHARAQRREVRHRDASPVRIEFEISPLGGPEA
jgi:hypothetical protein